MNPAGPVTPAGGQRGVLEAALDWRAGGRAFVLAIVVGAEGSTYRKPGALAAVAADGERRGVVSGGCLEPALDALTQRALAAGAARLDAFDTRGDDDRVFGSGSGCRGLMRVLALPVLPERGCPLLEALAVATRDALPLRLALRLDAPALGRGLAWCGEDRFDLEADARHEALESLRWAAPGLHLLADGEPVALLDVVPAPHLLLLGAGPEAPPLLRYARTLGWRCSVADHRQALLARLDDADRRLLARPGPALAQLDGQRIDAALAMTHLAGADLEALQALARRAIDYVGLLGPAARRDELLAELDEDTRTGLAGRLRAPVGLKLGGEGPEAIALAIAAELQRVFHPRP